MDAALLQAAIGGDRGALGALFSDSLPALTDHIHKRLSKKQLRWITADDIVQQVFGCALNGIAKFQPRECGGFEAWLRKIADNEIRQAVRARARKKRSGAYGRIEAPAGADSSVLNIMEFLARTSHTASRSVARRERETAVRSALDELDEQCRVALVLRVVDELPFAEIAARLGCSVGSAQHRVRHAMKALRAVMGDGLAP